LNVMPLPDLTPAAPALSLATAFLSLTFAATFLIAYRRHPDVAGSAWWSLAGAMATLSFGGLFYRLATGGYSAIGFANSTLAMASAMCWLGLLSYRGQKIHWRPVLAGSMALLALNAVLFNAPVPVASRTVALASLMLTFNSLAVFELARGGIQRLNPAERALLWMSGLELVALSALSIYAISASSAGQFTFASAEIGALITSFFVSCLLRLVIYLSLISYRLQALHDQAQATLQLREAQSWALLEGLQAGVLSLDRMGQIRHCNSMARLQLGLSTVPQQEGLPRRLSIAGWLDAGGQPLQEADAPHEQALKCGQAVRDVLIGVPCAPSRSASWFLCNAIPTASVQGQGQGVVLTLVDMTDARAAQEREREWQERRAQAQRMESLGTLASGVAHDFNNILAAILGNVQLLKEDCQGLSEAQLSLGQVDKAAHKGRDLVARILAFGRQQGVSWQAVEMAEVLHDTRSLLQALRPGNVLIECDCPPQLPPILGDATQLGQVLLNLGTNAVHAIGRGPGSVRLSARVMPSDAAPLQEQNWSAQWRSVGELLCVRVQDDGCGMDASTVTRMFDPYFTTKAPGEGTGLGLAAVRGIVDAHGGLLEVDSELQRGTTFTLWLPTAGVFNGSSPPTRQHN
jgi:two-component system, cell cycle sensor histidine kinase and response regulator CckA